MERSKWVDRRFTFDCPPGWLPNIIDRLLGAPVRIQALVRDINEDIASRSEPGGWSVKEHIGHLTDLEELHLGRLEELKARKPALSAADMSNTKTRQAGHNQRSLQRLINDFSKQRSHFVHVLKTIDDDTHRYSAVHPRLKTKMRPIDVASFIAEHDDHHLATIRELVEKFRK